MARCRWRFIQIKISMIVFPLDLLSLYFAKSFVILTILSWIIFYYFLLLRLSLPWVHQLKLTFWLIFYAQIDFDALCTSDLLFRWHPICLSYLRYSRSFLLGLIFIKALQTRKIHYKLFFLLQVTMRRLHFETVQLWLLIIGGGVLQDIYTVIIIVEPLIILTRICCLGRFSICWNTI